MAETGAWMPMYWSDYFGDTMHLSTEEHGIYLILIGVYWLRGKPLPDDDLWLASVAKLSTKKWKNARPKVEGFFEIVDGEWRHKRIENEILKSSGRLKSARSAGKAGGLAKSKLTTTTTTTTKKRTKKNDPPAADSSETSDATAADQTPYQAMVDTWNRICGDVVPTVRRLTDSRRRSLKRRFIDDFGRSLQQWEAYCTRIRSSDFLTGKTGSERRGWMGFDWAVSPSNVAKVLEGNYDNRRASKPSGWAI